MLWISNAFYQAFPAADITTVLSRALLASRTLYSLLFGTINHTYEITNFETSPHTIPHTHTQLFKPLSVTILKLLERRSI